MEKVRIGVVGVGRGKSLIKNLYKEIGLDLVAICDIREKELYDLGKESGAATYTEYDKFLEHDMDAILLANYFHEHAPFAIKAMEAGKHVLSETSCNSTLAEGVALCRTVEKTGKIYMLAENYPYTAFNQEMKYLYDKGEIGQVVYAEGEYCHPMEANEITALSPGLNHWRSWIPGQYYCTHALAPLMMITQTMPKKVTSFSIVNNGKVDKVLRSDPGSAFLCRMDNGSVFRILGGGIAGHSIWYRLHGTKGAMETTRGPEYFGPGQVRVWHNEWELEPEQTRERVYYPEWRSNQEMAKLAGHGGGDFWVCLEFAKAVKSGRQPYLDVYHGVTMSSVGILAYRSALNDGMSFDIPDFTSESDRKKYENDDASPMPTSHSSHRIPPSIKGINQPSEETMRKAREIWEKDGYVDR